MKKSARGAVWGGDRLSGEASAAAEPRGSVDAAERAKSDEESLHFLPQTPGRIRNAAQSWTLAALLTFLGSRDGPTHVSAEPEIVSGGDESHGANVGLGSSQGARQQPGKQVINGAVGA